MLFNKFIYNVKIFRCPESVIAMNCIFHYIECNVFFFFAKFFVKTYALSPGYSVIPCSMHHKDWRNWCSFFYIISAGDRDRKFWMFINIIAANQLSFRTVWLALV